MAQTFTEEEKEINQNKIFIEHSKYYSNDELVKYHLTVKNELMEYCCQADKCPTKKGNWRRKKMYLILERKNCKPDDLRISNLRLICPNCYCQDKGPDYFSEYKKQIERKCKYCNYILSSKSRTNVCYVCNSKMQKINVSLNSQEYASLVNSIHDTSGNTSIAYVKEYTSIIDNTTIQEQKTTIDSKSTKLKYKPNNVKTHNKNIDTNSITKTINLNLNLDSSLLTVLDEL
jgi:hypothetical protein